MYLLYMQRFEIEKWNALFPKVREKAKTHMPCGESTLFLNIFAISVKVQVKIGNPYWLHKEVIA